MPLQCKPHCQRQGCGTGFVLDVKGLLPRQLFLRMWPYGTLLWASQLFFTTRLKQKQTHVYDPSCGLKENLTCSLPPQRDLQGGNVKCSTLRSCISGRVCPIHYATGLPHQSRWNWKPMLPLWRKSRSASVWVAAGSLVWEADQLQVLLSLLMRYVMWVGMGSGSGKQTGYSVLLPWFGRTQKPVWRFAEADEQSKRKRLVV